MNTIKKLLILISFMLILPMSQAFAQDANTYLAFAEKMPEVEGGLNALYSKVEYPEMAQKAGIEGKVYALAYIDESGNVTDVKIVKGIGGGCDEAAIAAVKKAKFKPGTNQGKPVKVKLTLQFVFKLK